jgi:hypothetical protein
MSYDNKPVEWRKWFGRIITIDPTKCQRFQCGGFSINAHNHPIEIIQPDAQVDRILEGIRDGRLKDITDSHKRGMSIKGIGHTATSSENTGKKVYITVDKNGGMAIKSAETPEEIAVCEYAIKQRGIIIPDEYKIANPIGYEGRVQPGQESLILHNLEEKVEAANTKVFGATPTVKPGPYKVN